MSPPALTRAAVADAAAYLHSWLAFRQRHDRIPGVQLALLHEDEVVLSTARGHADVEAGIALTADHHFRIASHSKMFTATAVAQLVEQGRLRFDDPASAHLPWLAGTDLEPVTLRELLAHAGGLTRDGLAHDHWQLGAPFPDADELRRVASADAKVLERNERFKYSNVGYSLLGAVIEAVTGTSYAAHVTAAILEPLGLRDTGPELDPTRVGRLAVGYSALSYGDRRLPIEHVDTRAMAAATGFYATAADVVRFCAAQFLGDERLVSDDSKRTLQHTAWKVEGGPTRYGLGFAVIDVGQRRLLGHGGGYPGHITRSLFDPKARLAVSVLTNAIDGPAAALASTAIEVVDLAASASERPPAGVDLERFTGRFASLWGVRDLVALDGRLYGLGVAQPDLLAEHTWLDVVDDDTLRVTKGPGYGSHGELIHVRRGADGSITSLDSTGMTMLPEAVVRDRVATRTSVTSAQPLVP